MLDLNDAGGSIALSSRPELLLAPGEVAQALRSNIAPPLLEGPAVAGEIPADGSPGSAGIFIAVHGHFYQPPRENPYLDTIVRQPSAAPFHDWNERINHECYRPNAFARVLNDRGEMVGLANNFEFMSFNVGPTLLSWLERHDLATYRRILDGDRRSCQRLQGKGNAIAQAYNHIILPLANERDKRTQIRWGLADFRARFGREAEGIWLAETAIDLPTLRILVEEGIRFTVLAPSQAARVRPLPSDHTPNPEWIEVGGGQIDPTRPYRCLVPDEAGDLLGTIDLFFYDGPISADMGFSNALESAEHFAKRLALAVRGDRPAQLISLATDGETFGHHKAGKEKCLTWALLHEFPKRGWQPVNFAYYLALHPPTWQVELKPITAWSCSHGVDRWQDDCGCGGGGEWHQRWRRPLRESLNWLRDRLAELYEREARRWLRDPWAARDDYVAVLLARSPATIDAFLQRHLLPEFQGQPFPQRVDLLRLLEMQRHALLMFTSCGWFFEEISRPEGVQILRYAGRAMDLAAEVAGVSLEAEFLEQLAGAPSNVAHWGNGAEIYRQLVVSDRVSPEQVVAAVAIEALFPGQPRPQQAYCYRVEQPDYKLHRAGALALAVGQVELIADVTGEAATYAFGVLHLGGWDFHCGVSPGKTRLQVSRLEERLGVAIAQGSAAQVILAIERELGGSRFGLGDLFAEDRHRLMRRLVHETAAGLDRLYDRIYRDNYGVLAGFHRDGLPVPRELQVAAEISLSQRLRQAALDLEAGLATYSTPQATELEALRSQLAELEAIAAEAHRLGGGIELEETAASVSRLVGRSIPALLDRVAAGSDAPEPEDCGLLEGEIDVLERVLALGRFLAAPLWLDPLQERYWFWLATGLPPAGSVPVALRERLLDLGAALRIDVAPWRTAGTGLS